MSAEPKISFLEDALAYAERGWHVFPVTPKEKRPYGKLVPRGFLEATTSPTKIMDWWKYGVPSANIGIATGKTSGFFVLDVDPQHGGNESLQDLVRHVGRFTGTLSSRTGSGGFHYLYSMPDDFDIRNSAGKIANGLDVRGTGGYIVAPPSIHPSGTRYEWLNDSPIKPAPRELLELIISKSRQRPEGAKEAGQKIPHGTQHSTLVYLAGKMRHGGMTADEIYGALSIVNRDRCEIPGPEENILKIAESISQYPSDNAVNESQFIANVVKQIAVNGELSAFIPQDTLDTFKDTLNLNGHESIQSIQSIQYPLEKKLDFTPFPSQVLHKDLQAYIRACSAAMNCDEALLGVPLLPILSAAIGNSYRVQIKKSWEEPATLWGVVISSSGQLKSPALHAMAWPVYQIESQKKERYDEEKGYYDEQIEAYNNQNKKLRDPAEKPAEPTRERVRLNDTTIETLAVVHAENPRGLVLVRDELAGWLGSFDRYARGDADMQNWIEFYEGRYVIIDRKSSNIPTLDIKQPFVSVTGTIQPRVFASRMQAAHFDSGFEARLLLTQPPERVRTWTTSDIMPDVKAAYGRLIERLFSIRYEGKSVTIPLSSEARELFAGYVNESADIISKIPDSPLRSKLTKYEAIVARIALILEVCHNQYPQDISAHAMQRAIVLVRWFRREAARVYQIHDFLKVGLSKDELTAEDLPDSFTWKDVSRVWGVSEKHSFKVLRRLVEKGIASLSKHGEYIKDTGYFGYFGYFDTPLGEGTVKDWPESIQSIQSSPHCDEEAPF